MQTVFRNRKKKIMSTAEAYYEETEESVHPDRDHLDDVIDEAVRGLKGRQNRDGHWAYELEADATIPSEYIMLEHFLDEIDEEVQAKLAVYLREIQDDRHAGWPLFHGGEFDISASVKAYLALKLTGEDIDAPHMVRAREAILAHGGAARTNVFTRIALALFGHVPWRAVPVMRVEVMLAPRWFPFHLDKVSYWSRTVMVPLFILAALKPRARNPRNVDIRELFVVPPEEERTYLENHTGSRWGDVFLWLDKLGRAAEPFFPKPLERHAINKALAWMKPRLNGEDGLGGIFPAMANTVMAFDALGYARDDPDYVAAWNAIQHLLVIKEDKGYCQPCLSPVWDTTLVAHALMEAGSDRYDPALSKALDWLIDRQITEDVGDWKETRPDIPAGGWAFEYNNPYYPDVDDTAAVVLALDRADRPEDQKSIKRATEWVLGMQSANGGWGAFDVDNTYYYLNHIPFADHGALLDPPTADVTGRCLAMLGQLGFTTEDDSVARGLAYLRDEQEEDGSWFGRWGTNYVYGTWSVLCALNAVGEDMQAPYIRKSVDWLISRQNEDGGWGEDGASYWSEHRDACKASTPSQTAWGLLALMAAGEVDNPAVKRGIDYLVNAERREERWEEEWYTAVGFPKVFYLRYHGYAAYFPIWALARYRNLTQSNSRVVTHGM